MTSRPLVIILYGQPSDKAAADETDVHHEIEVVARALADMGYATEPLALSIDLPQALARLQAARPEFVFNLCDGVQGHGALVHLAPTLLEHCALPYTGGPLDATFITTNKLIAKRFMATAGVPTPAWWLPGDPVDRLRAAGHPWILKFAWEHASIGLDDEAVSADPDHIAREVERRLARGDRDFFAEQFVDGREFNIALLAHPHGGVNTPEVLPPAEIRFIDFPADKPKLVGYRAKWDESSFEYVNTPRSFEFTPGDRPLLERLAAIATQCWSLFGLRGYARVDFRVDASGHPYVLEVNTNPCLSPDAGFAAAANRAGIGMTAVVRRIVNDRHGGRQGASR